MGYFCDGRASLVVGTHTHAPTADLRILPGGTAFMSDVGMTGDYNSVIGMAKDEPLQRFLRRIPSARFEAASGPATLCGVAVETDPLTGLAARVGAGAARRLPGTGGARVLGLSCRSRCAFMFAPRATLVNVGDAMLIRVASRARDERRNELWPDIRSSRTSCTARGGRTRRSPSCSASSPAKSPSPPRSACPIRR